MKLQWCLNNRAFGERHLNFYVGFKHTNTTRGRMFKNIHTCQTCLRRSAQDRKATHSYGEMRETDDRGGKQKRTRWRAIKKGGSSQFRFSVCIAKMDDNHIRKITSEENISPCLRQDTDLEFVILVVYLPVMCTEIKVTEIRRKFPSRKQHHASSLVYKWQV